MKFCDFNTDIDKEKHEDGTLTNKFYWMSLESSKFLNWSLEKKTKNLSMMLDLKL